VTAAIVAVSVIGFLVVVVLAARNFFSSSPVPEQSFVEQVLEEHQPQFWMYFDEGAPAIDKKVCIECHSEWPCEYYNLFNLYYKNKK